MLNLLDRNVDPPVLCPTLVTLSGLGRQNQSEQIKARQVGRGEGAAASVSRAVNLTLSMTPSLSQGLTSNR